MTHARPTKRLVAIIRRPYTGAPSRHLVGIPPMRGEAETRERLAVPRLLVIESRVDGIFRDRYLGREVGDIWHQSVEEAQDQAVAEYGENLGAWIEVPE